MLNSLVVISAPSGCGKDTIIEKVCQRLDGIGVSISCTTRKARQKKDGSYEQHGVDYFFIEKPEFEERIHDNGFLEHADVKGDLYGTGNKACGAAAGMVRTECGVPITRKDGKSMAQSRRGINQDILLLGEKDRRRDEPRGESTGDKPEQYADACEFGDAVR